VVSIEATESLLSGLSTEYELTASLSVEHGNRSVYPKFLTQSGSYEISAVSNSGAKTDGPEFTYEGEDGGRYIQIVITSAGGVRLILSTV
jgi:hypothetical protein